MGRRIERIFLFCLSLFSLTAYGVEGKLVMADTVVAASNQGEFVYPVGDHAQSITIAAEFVKSPLKYLKGMPDYWWGVEIVNNDNEVVMDARISLTSKAVSLEDEACWMLPSIKWRKDGTVEETVGKDLKFNGASTIKLEWGDGKARVLFGSEKMEEALNAPLEIEALQQVKIICGRDLRVMSINECEIEIGRVEYVDGAYTCRSFGEYSTDRDKVTGDYQFLDEQYDTAVSRRGGSYQIRITQDGEGQLTCILMGGAEINKQIWTKGSVKARMRPTTFQNHFDCVWLDADGNETANDVFADYSPQTGVLTVTFPYQKAVMRFVKFVNLPNNW